MRVSVVCTDLGIRLPGDKGASMHLAAITSALAAIGNDVQLIAVAGHDDPPPSLTGGLADVHLLPHPGRAEGLRRERNKLAFVEHVASAMAAPVRRFRPDVVYERSSLFGVAGARLAAAAGCPHIVEVNALLAEEDSAWRGLVLADLARRVERHVLADADLAVAVSDEIAKKIRVVAPTADVAVVPNGAEVERFRALPDRLEARRHLGLPLDAPLAVFVGALRPWHGVDLALDAVARTPDWHLAVVGDGPIRPDLEQQARDLGMSRLHLLGQRSHDDVVACLAAGDAALAPYPALDGFSFSPLKLYEYLAAGIPVIASDIGQIPAVLDHGRWGTLVPAGDITALATALGRVAADPAGRRRAAAARDHALAHHGWDDRARQIAAHAAALDVREPHRALA